MYSLHDIWNRLLFPATLSFTDGDAGGTSGSKGSEGSEGSEGGQSGQNKSDETVSKEEFEKLQSQFSKIQADLEEAHEELLSPEYLETKRRIREGRESRDTDHDTSRKTSDASKQGDVFSNLSDDQINALPPRQLANLILNTVVSAVQETVLPAVDQRFQSQAERQRAERAQTELNHCLGVDDTGKENVPGFREFYNTNRRLLVEIANEHPSLGVEDVFWKAKRQVERELSEEERIKAARSSSEKPGSGTGKHTTQVKEFKDAESAAADAFDAAFG